MPFDATPLSLPVSAPPSTTPYPDSVLAALAHARDAVARDWGKGEGGQNCLLWAVAKSVYARRLAPGSQEVYGDKTASLWAWNDALRRTQDQVVALFDKAIVGYGSTARRSRCRTKASIVAACHRELRRALRQTQ